LRSQQQWSNRHYDLNRNLGRHSHRNANFNLSRHRHCDGDFNFGRQPNPDLDRKRLGESEPDPGFSRPGGCLRTAFAIVRSLVTWLR
jgi:hypothetical protein